MASIYFVGTFRPIVCGIADYTWFLGRDSPDGQWGVLSFDPASYGGMLSGHYEEDAGRVWPGIPGDDRFSARVVLEGLRSLDGRSSDAVLWFQHESGVWNDGERFAALLAALSVPKVVTFHTLHFQSDECPSGLRRREYRLLRAVLPYVNAITVFSDGVRRAVLSALPEYAARVAVLKHGAHLYPEVSRYSRAEAKLRLNDFLLSETRLDPETKQALRRERTLLDDNTAIIGQTGFLCPLKQSELLFRAGDDLQRLVPSRRVVAMRIGSPRDEAHKRYARRLRRQHNNRDNFLLEVFLPPEMLPVAQRAFDVNFHWPRDCTQSGVLSHALGAGAVIAGRDMEGVGETLHEAGAIVDNDFARLLLKISNVLVDDALRQRVEKRAMEYAGRYSWPKQAERHYRLADRVTAVHSRRPLAGEQLATRPAT